MSPRTRISPAKEFQRSNATTKAFLGGKEKAWMTGQPLQATVTSPSVQNPISVLRHQDLRASSNPNSTISQHGPSRKNASPSALFEPSSSESFPTLPSTSIAANPASPASASSALGEVSWALSENAARWTSNTQNLPPSPSPSLETRQQSANIPEVEPETNQGSTLGGPQTTRLAKLLAKYGGFEELERRLEVAEREKSILVSSSNVAAQRQNSIPDTAPTCSGPVRRQPPSLPNEPRPILDDLHRHSTTVSNKRAQDIVTEPCKRLQSLPSSPRRGLHESFSVLTAPPTTSLRPRPPSLTRADMQGFSMRVASQLQHVQSQYNETRLNVMRPRLKLLREACERSEYSYLLLHQIYCLDYRLQNSNHKLGLTDLQKSGLNIVSYLLVSNDQLAPETLQWFCDFPLPIDAHLIQTPPFQEIHQRVMRCLEKLANEWDNLRTQCLLRRYPPLVDELRTLFGISTFTFQKVVATAILREVWSGPQDSCFRAIENVFLQNRIDVTSRANASDQAIQAYNRRVMAEYAHIIKGHASHQEHSTTPSTHYPQANFPTARDTHFPAERPSRTTSIPGDSGRPPMHVDIQAAQQGGKTRYSTGSIAQISSTSATPRVPLVRQLPPSRQNDYLMPRPSSNANDHSTSQGAPLVQLVTPLQGIRPLGGSNSHSNNAHGQEQWRTQAVGGTTNQAHVGAPIPPASHVRPSNGPTSFGFRGNPLEQGFPSMQQQFIGQTADVPHHRQSFNEQFTVSRLQDSSAAYPNQFIRIDPSVRPNPPNPDVSALHQAHVKSPILIPSNIRASPNTVPKYFRFVSTVLMPREVISCENRHVSWEFTTETKWFEHLAKDYAGSYGVASTKIINSKSLFCRIRCVKLINSGKLPTESEWAVSDNIWPGSTAVILNGKALEIRKRSHHGKDLPIDITGVVRAGKNTLSTAVIGFPKDNTTSFAIGVEIIEVATEEEIKTRIRVIPLQEARQRIVDRSFQFDPDVEVVFSQLSVDLTDPFTSRIFSVPARGSNCRHNQCFDLEVFLLSRNIDNPSAPCGPDSFRCPMCGADARPQSLVVDGFLVSVRERLQKIGRLDAKAIILHPLGDWEIKEEEESKGVQGDTAGSRGGRAAVGRQSAQHEVIEIDDD